MSNEIPLVYCKTTPHAKKAHRCVECRGEIVPGESYHRHWGVWNGECNTFKVCRDCEALSVLISQDRSCWEERPYLGGLVEDVMESDVPEWDAALLEIMLKRRVNAPDWLIERVADQTKAAEHRRTPRPGGV